jgi:hypothetical protein
MGEVGGFPIRARSVREKALGKSGFLDFDFPVLDLSCDIPSVLLVFDAEVGGGTEETPGGEARGPG